MKIKATDLFTNNYWPNEITIEPSLAIIYVSSVVEHFLFVNLFLQKACRHNATGVGEPDLNTRCDDEKAGQKFLTNINAWRLSASMSLMIIFTVFGSAWSDNAGGRRKPLIFIALMGQTAVTVLGSLYSYFWQWPAIGAAILEALVHGLTGGRIGVLFFSQMYIRDITTEENRAGKMGVVAAVAIICVPTGNAISGLLLKNLGFFRSFSVCTLLTLVGILTTVIFIRDTSVTAAAAAAAPAAVQKITIWQTLKPTRVYESFKVIFRKRPRHKRRIIILLICVDLLSWFSITGESSVVYLYLRYRFGWDEQDYSVYVTYKLILVFIGTIFTSIVLSKYLKIHDAIIGIFSCSLSTLCAVLFVFANNNWELYAVPVIGMFRASFIALVSSFQTKCVERNETGHLMSVRCVLTLTTPLCFPAYNFLYHTTMDTFPSAFFILTSLLGFPTILLFGLAYYLNVRTQIEQITTPATDRT